VLEGENSVFIGSHALKNNDGNIPGKFHKGRALIKKSTVREVQPPSVPVPLVRDSSGRLSGLILYFSDAIEDVMTFPADCSHCSAQGHCRVCVTDVPHFKEVILMAFTCEEECG
jgi:hypothetical protein